ncbi:hypothetical protein MTO96_046183 [Rhipicephalus appendiculatus]
MHRGTEAAWCCTSGCTLANGPFRCHLCSRGFAHRSHVVRHIRTHTGERPFRCPLCPAAFSQRSNVKVHLRSHGLQFGSSQSADANGTAQQATTLRL